jgi:hypothetical protein
VRYLQYLASSTIVIFERTDEFESTVGFQIFSKRSSMMMMMMMGPGAGGRAGAGEEHLKKQHELFCEV